MTFWHSIRAVALASLLGMITVDQILAAEAWVRIDQPSAELRARLPAEAVDYGMFVWMPESALSATQRRSERVHRSMAHFALPIQGQPGEPADLPTVFDRVTHDADQPRFHWIQFQGPIKPAWLDSLTNLGLRPVQFIAPNAYLVWGREDQLPAHGTGGADRIRFAGPVPDSKRLQPLAQRHDAHHHARALIYRPTAHGTLQALRQASANVRDWRPIGGELLVVDLEIAPEHYGDLLTVGGVLTVQQVTQDAGSRGEMANQSVLALEAPDQTLEPGYRGWLDSIGLDGSGVVVAVIDEGIRQTHQDLAGQFLDCIPGLAQPSSCSQADNNHGTHVAGAIAGTGASGTALNGFLRGLGMAPGARLVQQRYPPLLGAGPGGMLPGGMLTLFAESALSGAVLANNSWGPSTTPQGYDIPSREVDLITRNALPEAAEPAPILPVWSIMNGGGDNPNSACAPSSLGAPDEAKNLLAVGSSKLQFGNGGQRPDLFDLSTNSAHGPACDGRRVPQLIAPGCSTDNPIAAADDAYSSSFCGTSMAAPIATGAAALFIEQYRHDHNGRNPSPALIRAHLTASAQNLQGFRDADGGILGHRPDRKQGWGRLDAKAVLEPERPVFMLDQTRILTATGQAWTGRFEPVDPAAPMQIMLAWTDAPGHGLGGALPAWVNDLDLIVQRAEDVYYGNGFGADGYSITGTAPDPRNNLEGVVLTADQHLGQALRIEVLAANLAADALDPWNPVGPAQDFALVCSNCQQAPDFTLHVAPQAIRACLVDGPLHGEVTVRSVLGFDETVSISVQALDGFTGTFEFDGTSEVPDFSRTISIGTDAAQAGDYRLLVEGSSTNSGSIISTLNLALEAPLTTAPAAVSPPQGTPVSIASGFDWAALEGAGQYLFELAEDPQFGELLESRLIEEPNWQPETWLAPDTDYYWRVRGRNRCGDGVVSETFSFRTNAGPLSDLAFVAQPVPDGEGGFLEPIQVEIRGVDGAVRADDSQSLIELSLADAVGNISLTGTLVRQVNNGVATFDDLGINAESAGEFILRASLSGDETLAITGFSLGTLQVEQRRIAAGLATRSAVTGVAFSGTVSGITNSPSFASDLRLSVTAPDGTSASLGGFETSSNQPWAFAGEGSGTDGRYESEHPALFSGQAAPLSDEGFWRFEFRNDFSGGELMSWSDVQITLIKQPIEVVSGTIPVQGSRIFQDRFELD